VKTEKNTKIEGSIVF